MMGRLQRERIAMEERLGVYAFRVRRWTAFEWTHVGAELRDEQRQERASHLKRAAGIVGRKLGDIGAGLGSVMAVTVEGEPQLLFQINLAATDERDAARRATYRFERALSAKVPVGLGRQTIRLQPPWGEVEVERL